MERPTPADTSIGQRRLFATPGLRSCMSSHTELVAGVVARYWLHENLYCGLSLSHIADRLPSVPRINIDAAISQLEAAGEVHTTTIGEERWVYPNEALLAKHDDTDEAKVGRYTKLLRRGGSQVRPMYFRRSVLDRYRDDPRYHFDDDVHGYIGIRDRWYLDDKTPEADKISIQFGEAYTENDERNHHGRPEAPRRPPPPAPAALGFA
jgi:hypothetical protein